ncbi:MAG: hypothetical protein ACXAC7_17130 [Candidatus Hodarchaeales archaeon]
MESDSASNNYCYFEDRSHATLAPKLEIVYTPIPEGNPSILLIFGLIGISFTIITYRLKEKYL